ncbi:MAG: A24 family peptidase [Rhodospirillaceae bacterium]
MAFGWETEVPHGLLLIGLGLAGALVGSFLNVVIHRLPEMMRRRDAENEGDSDTTRYDLALPPSSCPHCGHLIRAHENIPLLSYLLLRGRCSGCRQPIALRYPLVELLGITAPLLLAGLRPIGPEMLSICIFAWFSIAIAAIDINEFLVPDDLSLPLLWLGLLIAATGLGPGAVNAIYGAVAGYMLFLAIHSIGRKLARRPVLGMGDVKLAAAIGAWVGWSGLPEALFIGCALGSIIGIGLIVLKRSQRGHPIPFGPFLVSGALAWLGLH